LREVFYEGYEFWKMKLIVSRLAVPEAREVGNIYTIMLRELFSIPEPCSGAITASVDYDQRFALPTGKVADVKAANFYVFALYIVRYLLIPFL
jgi:hypothetical protein